MTINFNHAADAIAGSSGTLNVASTLILGSGLANYIQATGGATTVAPVVQSLGSDPNIPLVLQPKGTGASSWTIAVTADTTNGGLSVTFTGQAATIRTVCQIRTTEMTY